MLEAQQLHGCTAYACNYHQKVALNNAWTQAQVHMNHVCPDVESTHDILCAPDKEVQMCVKHIRSTKPDGIVGTCRFALEVCIGPS